SPALYARAERYKNLSGQVPHVKLEAQRMADDPMTTPRPSRGKGGRPRRAEASAKGLAGIALSDVDPLATLRAIAADTSQPGSTRVSAARVLLELRDKDPAEGGGDPRVNERAIELMRRAN